MSVDGRRSCGDDNNDMLEREAFGVAFGVAAEIGGELLKVAITLWDELFVEEDGYREEENASRRQWRRRRIRPYL